MLYELWRAVAAARRNDWALRDAGSGRAWTFGELFAAGAANAAQRVSCKFVFPQGNTPQFILDLLAAWREGSVACPLEIDQSPPAIDVRPAAWAHLKMTSATTGPRRMVGFTAEQLAADAGNIVATMGLRADWPNLGVISIAHSYGFSNLVLPLLLHGIPLILVPAPLPEAVRRAAEGESAVTLPAVPAMWRAWHEADAIPMKVRLAISAGAPLPLGLERDCFAARGLKIHNSYGSTECGGIAYDTSSTPRDDEACIGEPLKGVQLSVNGENCLTVQSSAVGEGYFPAADACLGNGRFQTNDLVELKDGLVFLRGRTSDFINVAGRKVSPLLIERELSAHPAVAACVVFGAPDTEGDRADLIVAAVVPRTPVNGAALRQFMLARVPAWQVPRDWLFVESLTANRLGKISRTEWRAKYSVARSSSR